MTSPDIVGLSAVTVVMQTLVSPPDQCSYTTQQTSLDGGDGLPLSTEMPGKVRVKVVAGRNLPVMDRSSDTTDAFAEVKLGDTTYKTDVYRKSLNPAWNSDWFK